MLERYIEPDITILVEDQVLSTHRALLQASSPVFRAMLAGNFRENSESRISIEDFSAVAIRAMLDYLISGTLKPPCFENLRVAIELLACAEKYCMEPLKRAVEVGLRSHVSVDNAVELAIHATRQNAVGLAKLCVDCIARNFEEVSNSPGYKSLPAPVLQRILLAVSGELCEQKRPWKRRRRE